MTFEFNWIDYLFITIFAMSFVAGLARGLVRELIGLIALAAAVVLAVMFAQPLAMHFAGASADAAASGSQPLSYIAVTTSFLLIFAGVILVGALIGFLLNLALGFGVLSAFNRLLGGIFGIIRAFALIVVIMFIVNMTPTADNPQWQASEFVQRFKPAVDWLETAAAPSIVIIKERVSKTVEVVTPTETTETTTPTETTTETPATPPASEGAPVTEATPEPANEPVPAQ